MRLTIETIESSAKLPQAADVVVIGGGIIGVDKYGNVAMPFNTKGMYRGYIKSTGEKYFGMYEN